jgi:hypothetical protein
MDTGNYIQAIMSVKIQKKVYVVFLCLFLRCLFSSTSAQVIQSPDNFHGPRTKWTIYPDLPSGPDCTGDCINRHSIIPQIDIPLDEWLLKLEEVGANAATINLEARRNLRTNPVFTTFEITAADINYGRFTPAQRNIQLLDFLIRVQGAVNRGAVHGNIRFHVHQRLYPRRDVARENQFIRDFSDFINEAKALGVDHLIAGIRLGEHGTDGRNYVLDFALKTARAINENTGGWLKEKGGFEMSGDEYGRMFKDIHNMALSATFFDEISKVSGYFAFCYKAFGVGGAIRNLGYDTDSAAGWEAGLLEGMGLADLIGYIQAHREQYPLHANVIFIGDSGDALRQFGNIEYTITTKLLSDAGNGFQGIIGVNGYRRPDKDTADDYLYLFDALGTDNPILKPNTIKRWQAWPLNDGHTQDMITVLAMSGSGGFVSPAGPLIVERGTDMTFQAIPQPGYNIDKVMIDGEALSHDDGSFTLSNISENQSIQVTYKKAAGSRHRIISVAYDHGSITPNGIIELEEDASQLFTITPDPGYQIKSLVIDGLEMESEGESVTIESIDRDYTIQVHFESTTAVPALPAISGDQVFYDHSNNSLVIYNEDQPGFVTVFNTHGMPVFRTRFTGSPIVLPDIPLGYYISSIINDNGTSLVYKFLVVR